MGESIKFGVYDKTGAYQRTVVARSSSTELPANGIPTAAFVLDDDEPALEALAAKGARCSYHFRGVEWFRGRVGPIDGVGPLGQTTFLVEGDARKLWDWQGSPKPTDDNLSTPRTINQEYARYTGVTEAVVRSALVANFTRLGVPWAVAPSSGRGKPSRRLEFRWHPLGDKIMPLLDEADLITELTYHPTTGAVTVSWRDAVTLSQPITEYVGVIDRYAWSKNPPSATRVVVGGSGEGIARTFLRKIDAARESDWGDIIETFKDARMSDAGADLGVDADEALAEGAPTVGIGMDAMESVRFRLADHFLPGDRVPVRLARLGGLVITERITKVTIDDDPDSGVTVTPRLGAVENTADAELGAIVARLARGVRDQGRR